MTSPLVFCIQRCRPSAGLLRLPSKCIIAKQCSTSTRTDLNNQLHKCLNTNVAYHDSSIRLSTFRSVTRAAWVLEQNQHFSVGGNHGYCQQQQRRQMHCGSRLMAGHSKWQNIKGTKMAKDQQRSQLFAKFGKLIRIAIKEGGSPNPALNAQLAQVIQAAQSKDMPKTTIDNAIKQAVNSKAAPDVSQVYEVKGPGGSAFLVDIMTDNPAKCRQDLTKLIKTAGTSVENSGTLMYAFDRKGVVRVKGSTSSEPLTLDLATEVAIEVEAEDVQETSNEDGEPVFMFICEPNQVKPVKENLTSNSYTIESAGLEYIAVEDYQVEVTGANLEKAAQIIQKIEEHADVLKVYDNIRTSS